MSRLEEIKEIWAIERVKLEPYLGREETDWLICRIEELEQKNTERNEYNLKLLKRVEKLEAALQWYAEPSRYSFRIVADPEMATEDCGERARKALSDE